MTDFPRSGGRMPAADSVPGPQPPPPPAFIRPMLGLLAGLGIMVVVVLLGLAVVTTLVLIGGADLRAFASPAFYLAILALSVLGAMAGGFTTARVTSGRSFYSVFLLAVILLVSAAVPWLRHAPLKPGEPEWIPLLVALLVPLGILVGGWLERRQVPSTDAVS